MNNTYETGDEFSKTSTTKVDGGLNFGVAKTNGYISSSDTDKKSEKVLKQYIRNPKIVALQELLEINIPLIIDDFHYIDRDIQTSIIRPLKDPVFEGLRVIIIAVPHRAYDTVKVENEMTGRVSHLQIPLWTFEELMEIPSKGFPELNAMCREPTIKQFTRESFGSPHLNSSFYNGTRRLLRILSKNSVISFKISI